MRALTSHVVSVRSQSPRSRRLDFSSRADLRACMLEQVIGQPAGALAWPAASRAGGWVRTRRPWPIWPIGYRVGGRGGSGKLHLVAVALLQTFAMCACAWMWTCAIVAGHTFGLPVHAHVACCSALWRRRRPAMGLGRQCARYCVSDRSKRVRACTSNFRNLVLCLWHCVGYASATGYRLRACACSCAVSTIPNHLQYTIAYRRTASRGQSGRPNTQHRTKRRARPPRSPSCTRSRLLLHSFVTPEISQRGAPREIQCSVGARFVLGVSRLGLRSCA